MSLEDIRMRRASVPFGVGIAMLGAMTFAFGDAVHGLEPLPASLGTARIPLAYAAGLVLIVAGVLVASGRHVRRAAVAIGAVLSVWLLMHVGALARNVHSGSEWVCAFETLSLWAAAWAIVAMTPAQPIDRDAAAPIPPWVSIGCLGVACIVFGVSHFLYIGYVKSVLPAWLPWHTFWGYGTGVAHLAAGVALVTRVRARLAAVLLGVMFGSWVLILHLPRVVRDANSQAEWTSMCVALAMCGTSWVIASSIGRRRATAPLPHVASLVAT